MGVKSSKESANSISSKLYNPKRLLPKILKFHAVVLFVPLIDRLNQVR
jgi:hypothetical protein